MLIELQANIECGRVAAVGLGDIEQQHVLVDIVIAVQRITLAFAGVGFLGEDLVGEGIVEEEL